MFRFFARPSLYLTLAVAVCAPVLSAVPSFGIDPTDPVANQAQSAFVPLREGADELDEGNTPVAGYDGELLSVRSVPVGRRSAEPTIGIQSDGDAYYAAANFDSVGGLLARTELLRSADGGITWTSVQTKNAAVKSLPPGNLDPYVWVDPATDRIFNVDLLGCGYLQTSDDDGTTWSPSLAACGDSIDHQSLFGGPRPEGLRLPKELSSYESVIYYCTNRVLDSRCGRSLDGGTTWITTATPAYPGFDPSEGGMCNGLHGHGIVDNEGRIVLPKGHCGYPYVAISEDGGDTWFRTRVSNMVSGTPVVPIAEYAGTFAHTSVAADGAGNLYYVWPDDEMRPWLSISRDHGRSWETPMLVAPPGVSESNFPTVSAGGEGDVAITFVGSPAASPGALGSGNNQAALRRPWNYYVLASTDALADEPVFLSTTANDPVDPIHRGDCFSRCGGMFDFIDVVVAPSGEIWATASDTCTSADCLDGGRADGDVGVGLAIRQVGGPLLLDDPAPEQEPEPGARGRAVAERHRARP